jgi:hypothetical protein
MKRSIADAPVTICNEVHLLFGQGVLERNKYMKPLEQFAEKVMPRCQGWGCRGDTAMSTREVLVIVSLPN